MEHLAGVPPVHQIPTDRLRPAVQTYAGARELVLLSSPLSARLSALSRQTGATLFMTLLAAFHALLCRYTAQEDHVVGTSVAGRTLGRHRGSDWVFREHAGAARRLFRRSAFPGVAERLRQVALEAFAHQELPFELLVEELQPERNLSYPPLFQVALTLQNASPVGARAPRAQIAISKAEEAAAKYDLLLDIWESGEGIAGALEYNTDLFDRATAQRMLRHYRNLLEGSRQLRSSRLSELPLLTKPSVTSLLVEWNEVTGRLSAGLCIHELFEQQAASSPDVAAVFAAEREPDLPRVGAAGPTTWHATRSIGRSGRRCWWGCAWSTRWTRWWGCSQC